MSQSVYIRLATVLVRLDIHRENQAWKRKHRRERYVSIPLSTHMLRDIGFERDGRPISGTASPHFVAKREVMMIRRRLRLRSPA